MLRQWSGRITDAQAVAGPDNGCSGSGRAGQRMLRQWLDRITDAQAVAGLDNGCSGSGRAG